MKHRRKRRFTNTDVNTICKLKDELIQYKQAYKFLFYSIINAEAGKDMSSILVSDLPDDSVVHYVNRTIREWSEKLYPTNKEKKDD